MKYLLIMLVFNAMAGKVIVDQKDKSFKDAGGNTITTIKIKLGDTLVFKNSEADISHNVFSETAGNTFELVEQAPGQSSDVTINAPKHKKGKMQVQCAIHPGMKLEVTIE